MERTIYQVFEVDSIKTVNLEILDLYDLYTWAGNSILIETNVQIWHASPEILNHLIDKGRYAVDSERPSPDLLRITTKDRERKPIKTPAGECTEIATAKIFVPDIYLWSEDKKQLTRKEEPK